MDLDGEDDYSVNKNKENIQKGKKKEGNKNVEQPIITENLIDKYDFKIFKIIYNDLELSKEKKKLTYKNLEHSKCSPEYNIIRYFNYMNINKKSKINSSYKMSEGKTQVNLLKKKYI